MLCTPHTMSQAFQISQKDAAGHARIQEIIDIIKKHPAASNALCYLIPLVQKAATPAMVDEGFDQAGLHPLNYGKIMHNMYDYFDDLTQEQAAELIRVASVELGEVFRERGLIYGRESEAACAANPILNRVLEFPEMPANLEHLAWNRQTLRCQRSAKVALH